MKQKTYQHVCPNASLKNANINEKELISLIKLQKKS